MFIVSQVVLRRLILLFYMNTIVHSSQQFNRAARASYAKMITRLFEHWKLSERDQLALLGLNEKRWAMLNRYREGSR